MRDFIYSSRLMRFPETSTAMAASVSPSLSGCVWVCVWSVLRWSLCLHK